MQHTLRLVPVKRQQYRVGRPYPSLLPEKQPDTSPRPQALHPFSRQQTVHSRLAEISYMLIVYGKVRYVCRWLMGSDIKRARVVTSGVTTLVCFR